MSTRNAAVMRRFFLPAMDGGLQQTQEQFLLRPQEWRGRSSKSSSLRRILSIALTVATDVRRQSHST
jgi:hypothetical protein